MSSLSGNRHYPLRGTPQCILWSLSTRSPIRKRVGNMVMVKFTRPATHVTLSPPRKTSKMETVYFKNSMKVRRPKRPHCLSEKLYSFCFRSVFLRSYLSADSMVARAATSTSGRGTIPRYSGTILQVCVQNYVQTGLNIIIHDLCPHEVGPKSKIATRHSTINCWHGTAVWWCCCILESQY